MDGHHLILGDLEDYITGEILKDTHDERYRQKVSRILVEQKGFLRPDISPRLALFVRAGDKCAIIKIDFGVTLSKRMHMIIKYGPGSIVTRHRPALAASRLLASYQIPVVVVTNGEDAEILDGSTGKIIHTGLESIPGRSELLKSVSPDQFSPISAERSEMESRILYAYDVDGSCPCDDTICRIESE
jgi:hypothetical protein